MMNKFSPDTSGYLLYSVTAKPDLEEWVQFESQIYLIENEDSYTDNEWNNLYKLSEETFVEESDSLKEGAAGAGLTDND